MYVYSKGRVGEGCSASPVNWLISDYWMPLWGIDPISQTLETFGMTRGAYED